MSELVTNKITPGTGSSDTVTLGDSGDTFSIPSGATIANSGTATGFLPAAGTSGNVLTSDGTNWASTAPAGGGAWNLIASTSISSVSTVDFTSGISSTYVNYVLVGSDVILNTPGGISVRLSSDGGSSWYSSSNYDYTNRTYSAASTIGAVTASANQFDITASVEAGNGLPTCFVVEFWNLSQSATHKAIHSRTHTIKSSGQSQGSMSWGSFKANNAINGIQVLADGGAPTLVSGRITLYGIVHA